MEYVTCSLAPPWKLSIAMAASVSSSSTSLSQLPPLGNSKDMHRSWPRRVEAYSARCSHTSPHPHASRDCERSSDGLMLTTTGGLLRARWSSMSWLAEVVAVLFVRVTPSPTTSSAAAAERGGCGGGLLPRGRRDNHERATVAAADDDGAQRAAIGACAQERVMECEDVFKKRVFMDVT